MLIRQCEFFLNQWEVGMGGGGQGYAVSPRENQA